jgi:hypothetical protein
MRSSIPRALRRIAVGPLAVIFAAGTAAAQLPRLDPAQMQQAYLQQRQQTARALRQYEWKSRTETQVNDKTSDTSLFLVRYDPEGKQQKTRIGGEEATKGGGRPRITLPGKIIGARKQKKAAEEAKEFQENLQRALSAYENIPPDKLRGFFENASFQPGKGELSGTIRIQGNDIVQTGDTMTLWVDPRTRETRQSDIRTTLEGKPMRIASLFAKLPDGVPYTKQTIVDIEAKKMRIITENFDYTRAAGP